MNSEAAELACLQVVAEALFLDALVYLGLLHLWVPELGCRTASGSVPYA